MIKYVSQAQARAIAQLGRAPCLHARQFFFFRGVHHGIKKFIEKSMSYSTPFREQENNSLTKDSVQFGCLFRRPIEPIIDLRY